MAGPLIQLCNKRVSARRRIDVPLDDFGVGDRLSIKRFVTRVIGFQGRTIETEACECSLVIVKTRKKHKVRMFPDMISVSLC